MATASNRVEVDLIANDRLTPVLNRIRGMANDMRGTFDNVGGRFFQDLTGGVVVTAIDAVTSSVRAMGSAIQDASRMQTSSIVSASDVALGLKISMDDSLRLVDDTQIKLARIAADLPGEVSDFTAIFRQVSSAVAPLSKDPIDFQARVIDISKRAGVLASVAGASAEQSGSVLDRFISGTSTFSELALNDIFQKNAVFNGEIKKLMAQQGFQPKDLKKMTPEARINTLESALKTATPDTLLERFSGTAESMIQQIKSKLFDPLSGVFGLLRKVPGLNNRSALDAFAAALGSFYDLILNFGIVAKKLGFDLDPMRRLGEFFDHLRDFFNGFSMTILAFAGVNGLPGLNISELGSTFASAIGSFLDGAISMIGNLPMTQIGEGVSGFLIALASAILTNVPKLVWLSLTIFRKLLETLFGALVVAPVKGLFQDLVRFVNLLISPIKKPIEAFFGAIMNFFNSVKALIPNIPGTVSGLWNSASGGVGKAIEGVGKTVLPFFGLGQKDPSAPTTPLPQQTLPNKPQAMGATPPFVANLSVTGSATDAQAIAQAVMGQLNQAYGTFKQGSIA